MSIIEQCNPLRPRRLGILVGDPAGSDRELALNQGDFYRIKGNRSFCMITCQNGAIWITQEHDHQDYVLTKGEILIVKRPGLVLVEALREASIQIKNGHN